MRALAVALVLLAAPAWAAEVPRIDVDRECRAAASDIAKSFYGFEGLEKRYSVCMEINQQSYDAIKIHWDTLGEVQRVDCLSRWPDRSDSFYMMLKGCVAEAVRQQKTRVLDSARDAEMRAIPKKEFRY